jgi:orotidine-5'-phosphate decarboxylase
LKYADKGAFILCLTSNSTAAQLQRKFIMLENPPSGQNLSPRSKARTFAEFFNVSTKELYYYVAELAGEWNENDNIGLVVGATAPQELEAVRKFVGDEIPILVPGVGAQGGDLEKAVRAGSNGNDELAIINISRGIIYSDSKSNFKDSVREAALTFRSGISAAFDQKV